MHHPTDRITHTIAFVTLVVEHWLKESITAGNSGISPEDNHKHTSTETAVS